MYNYSTLEVVNFDSLTKKPNECMKCHHGFSTSSDVVKIHYFGLGDGAVYAHCDCVKPVFYGNEEHENLGGTENVTYEKTPRTSMEIEMFNAAINPDDRYYSQHERQEKAWQLLTRKTKTQEEMELTDLYIKFLVFGTKHKEVKTLQDIGLDCSTALEGHITELSFEGSSKLFHNLTDMQVDIINNPHNGAHIHSSCANVTFTIFKACFDVLVDYFKALPIEKRIEYFGSDFRDYARAYVGYNDHGSCVNMSGIPTAELRIARFNNADQYVKLMKVWRGVVKTFNTKVEKVLDGTWSCEHVGKWLVKEFKNIEGTKYAKGR